MSKSISISYVIFNGQGKQEAKSFNINLSNLPDECSSDKVQTVIQEAINHKITPANSDEKVTSFEITHQESSVHQLVIDWNYSSENDRQFSVYKYKHFFKVCGTRLFVEDSCETTFSDGGPK
jgi:hypothetical protein